MNFPKLNDIESTITNNQLLGQTMLKIIYILITAIFLILSVIDLYDEKDWKKQLSNMVVIIPLILRVLLIK